MFTFLGEGNLNLVSFFGGDFFGEDFVGEDLFGEGVGLDSTVDSDVRDVRDVRDGSADCAAVVDFGDGSDFLSDAELVFC